MLDFKIGAGGDLYGLQLMDGRVVPFRLLSYKEYKVAIAALEGEEVNDWVLFDYLFNKCVEGDYFKNNREELQAGITQSVALLIIELSGPGDHEYQNAMLNSCRAKSQQIDLQMKTTICRVFPGYTMETLDDLSFPQLVQVFTQAEGVLLDQGLLAEPAVVYPAGADPNAPNINPNNGYGVITQNEMIASQREHEQVTGMKEGFNNNWAEVQAALRK